MMISERFKDKVAVITGGADGIGKGVALRLGMEGARIALFDINQKMLDASVEEFCSNNIDTIGFCVDVSAEEDVSRAISKVESGWGSIDILVNAAGIVGLTNTRITEYPTAEFDKVYQVNLRGTFLVTKYILEVMRKKGVGRVLLIASIAGKEGNPGMIGYSSTKAGVIGLVKAVAKEYADSKITVNGLAPAVIRTTMNENTSPEQLAYMTARIPMQRIGTIDEVAAMCCYIVSDENSFSTGFIYDISGGRATY